MNFQTVDLRRTIFIRHVALMVPNGLAARQLGVRDCRNTRSQPRPQAAEHIAPQRSTSRSWLEFHKNTAELIKLLGTFDLEISLLASYPPRLLSLKESWVGMS